MSDLSKEALEKLNAVKGKRAVTVVRHIIEHGFITSEDLEKTYGYNHPPRAVRDVREQGVPIDTYRVKSSDGRMIAAYRFGDFEMVGDCVSKKSGRTSLSRALKKALVDKYGAKCFIYLQEMDVSQLQVDHRIPYEITGEGDKEDVDCYMLLSPSANRAKSWTCEHCPNWNVKNVEVCVKCFWAHPEKYTHIAGKAERQIVITFTGDEIKDYDRFVNSVGREKAEAMIKSLVCKYIKE